MSQRNTKLLRRWARSNGFDLEKPPCIAYRRIFSGDDSAEKRELRKLMIHQMPDLKIHEKKHYQLGSLNKTPSRSARKRLGL